MASLAKAINKDLFDKILPTFGNPRVHVPVWDEGQKMFLCEEKAYDSATVLSLWRKWGFTTLGLTSTALRSMPSTVQDWNLCRNVTTTRRSVTKNSSVKSRKPWYATTSKAF